jgi:type I restriction enzyme, S subunit
MEKLGPYIKQIRGISYKPNEVRDFPLDNYLPIIKANNITDNGFDDFSLIFIHQKKIRPEQLIRTGDIILAASSGSKKIIGKNIQFDNDYAGSFGAFCKLIRPKEGLHPKYLYHFFRTPYYRRFIEKSVQGANINNLKNQHIDDMLLSIPSQIDDQIRIATLLSRVEALIATRKDNLRLLNEFLKSTFLEMFGDPVRNEKGWDRGRIKDIAEIRIGPFGSLLHADDYVEDGVPLINPSHVVEGTINPDNNLSISHEKYLELSAYHLKENDLVVARRGEIGRCAIVKTNRPLFCGTGSMFIRIQNDYPPILLQFQIYNTSLRKYLESKAKGVTMKNLNSNTLGNLEILDPPANVRDQFVVIVEKTELLKTLYKQNIYELENLYAAISQKAFKGELDLSRIPLGMEPRNTRKSNSVYSMPSVVDTEKEELSAGNGYA